MVKEIQYGRYPKSRKRGTGKTTDEIVKELKKPSFPHSDYRERSLQIHGLICAKCGREFDHKDRHLLTVQLHKDGNHLNNPPDGRNWKTLRDCREEEQSTGSSARKTFRKNMMSSRG
jgi:hypothetical protein